MLEETIPSIWASLQTWFTPTMFFILLNLVIGTIAVTSKSHNQSSAVGGDNHHSFGNRGAPLARAPSFVLDRLKSFDFSKFVSGEARNGDVHSAEDAGGDRRRDGGLTRVPSNVLERLRSFDFKRFVSGEVRVNTEIVDPEPVIDPMLVSHPPQIIDDHFDHHIERTLSDALPPNPKGKLPRNIKKSASDKSAFDHFKEVEILEEEDGEVDAKADDFINKFKNQLRLQRMNSIIRYKEMLTRGAGN